MSCITALRMSSNSCILSQNGNSDVETIFDTENPRFIRNGRDLATIAFADQLYTEAFRAALILFTQGVLGGEVGAYAESKRQMGFATFGEPHILTAMAASSSSTRHAWYQKVCPFLLLAQDSFTTVGVLFFLSGLSSISELYTSRKNLSWWSNDRNKDGNTKINPTPY